MLLKQNNRIDTERKLELVRSIRKAQEDNLAALNKREAILYGKPITFRDKSREWDRIHDKSNSEPLEDELYAGRKPILTFKVRLLLSVFLLGAYMTFLSMTDEQYVLEKAMVKTYIAKDFTNNLFAFMEDFPYTLEYENISTER
ncbi:MAG: hypothetical protein NC412_08400 [Roseburia sp.]|nr:hypothetical protein [Roseburia sp.]MCM1278840.1 hypothetical protein [Robinsoniella sp.]